MRKLLFAGIILLLVVGFASVAVRKVWQDRQFEKVAPVVGDISEAVYGLGKVKSNKKFEFKVGVTSTAKNVFVNEGDQVQKNQKLLSVESGPTLIAPFAGTITLLSAREGETVFPQTVLLRMEDLKDRFIEVALNQESALRISKNQNARITFESLRGTVLSGKVASIYPKEDELLVHINIDKMDDQILPGMSADVAIEVGKISGVKIPLKAVRNGGITLIRNGQRQKVKVEIGLTDGLSAEVKNSDLSESDLILVPKD